MSNLKDITLTDSQIRVLSQMKAFLESKDKVFVLKGYAGTGKTTLMRFLIQHLQELERGYHLLASTGRASTILNAATGNTTAQTIHSLIYKYSDFNQDLSKITEASSSINGQLYLVFKPCKADAEDKNQVYIIDEASMVSDTEDRNIVQAAFGSGRLLKELLEYDSDPGSKYIFVGDPCQLPPITQTFSPALSPQYIATTFGLGVQEGNLTEIVRQGNGNTIISTSQRIRQLYNRAPETDTGYTSRVWGKMPIFSSANIQLHPNGEDMIQRYLQTIRSHGYGYATYLCRGNAACYQIACQIRERLGIRGRVSENDLLLVIQNNTPLNLFNGDLVVVKQITHETQHRANLTFRKVVVEDLGNKNSHTTFIIEELLHSGKLNLDGEQQKALFVDFVLRMRKMGINPKQNHQQFILAMMTDPYLNALRCTFGYAITCHKSQGGEWAEVFVNMPRNIMLNPAKSSYQWVCTAITRAKERLHVVDDIYLESYRRY
ncbi:MAG: DEAD/DEAH box helicase [Bacteroidales bacterium]|nr:DEAD/DEAH box helicase [Bacteroidales bacterium]